MKKLILSAAFLAFAGAATVKANNVSKPLIDTAQQLTDTAQMRDTAQLTDTAQMTTDTTQQTIDTAQQITDTAQQDSTTKTPVKIEELPDPVKTTLSADKYKEWAPTGAFLVVAADKKEWYQIDVKKGEEVAALKVGKDGVVVQ